MGIHRSDETGNMCAQCDMCHDVVDFDDDVDFNQAKEKILCDRWAIKRLPNGKWQNICPDCRPDL